MELKELFAKIDFSKLSKREKIILVITVVFSVFFLFNSLYLPKLKEVKRLTHQGNSLNTEIINLSNQLNELRNKVGEIDDSEIIKERQKEVFFMEDRLSIFLREVIRLGRSKDIEIISFRPLEREENGAYTMLSISMNMRCRFQNLNEYIEALENYSIPIVIKDIKITTNSGLTPYILTELNATTFMKKG
ncbi:MAG: type 4a pilus biogenesis protein PilO [Nitrospirota bacterium]